MPLENIQYVASLLPTVSTLLAGFSFSIITGEFKVPRRPTLATFMFGCFLTAAALMIAVTCMSTSILISLAASNQKTLQTTYLHTGTVHTLSVLDYYLFVVGLIAFLAGGAFIGWMRSPAMGIFGSCIVAIAAILLFITVVTKQLTYSFHAIYALQPTALGRRSLVCKFTLAAPRVVTELGSLGHMKVLVFGNSGSGKSTYAGALAAQEGLAHLDLDSNRLGARLDCCAAAT